MAKPLPRIAITAGDPAGIGPEVVAKAVASPQVHKVCRPVVIGDTRLFKNYPLPQGLPCTFVDLPVKDLRSVRPGENSAAAGRAAADCILRAVKMVRDGEADAIMTAPISKAALNLAGVHYSGHTEMLADLTHTRRYAMLMVAGQLRSVMVTRHLPVADAGRKLTVAAIVEAVELSHEFLLQRARIRDPRIAVCALNPHAGEGGLLGREEGKVIEPALQVLRGKGIPVDGPLPCDSAWLKAKRRSFDMVVTMYHDQTMLALKCLAPERIVNVTIGLPFVRTSPGHGTGFDIAGKGLADPRPTIEAVLLAARLSR